MWKTINKILRQRILPPDAADAVGLTHWRNEFFFMICRLLSISGIVVIGVSVFSYIRDGHENMIFPIVGLGALLYGLIFIKSLGQKIRRWGIIIIIYLIGTYLLTQTGIQGSGMVFLFAHPIIAAVFFGEREAQISLWTNGLMLAMMNIALFFFPDLRVVLIDYHPMMWISITLTFLLLSAVITNAITRLVTGLDQALHAAITTRVELEAEIEHRIALEDTLQNERENLQVRVDERTSLLAKANEDLMKSMKFKDAFFDSIRHEFRTPIHAISGYTDLLFAKRDNMTDKQMSYLERIRESADHLLGVINNILDTTRIQAGMLDIQPVAVSLKEVCKNSLAYVEGDAIRKGVTIVPGNCGSTLNIKADPQRFKQILINLLENSVKYTPEGGALGLEMERTETEVRLMVWDTGIGIPDDDINNIFEPFYRSENRNVQDVEGTGLGLSLAKQLVEAHDWKITVDSELGKGSRFTIHIPIRDITEHTAVLYY